MCVCVCPSVWGSYNSKKISFDWSSREDHKLIKLLVYSFNWTKINHFLCWDKDNQVKTQLLACWCSFNLPARHRIDIQVRSRGRSPNRQQCSFPATVYFSETFSPKPSPGSCIIYRGVANGSVPPPIKFKKLLWLMGTCGTGRQPITGHI